MGDPNLNGAQENLFGNYIVQRGLANPNLRDEILVQVANQVSLCLSCSQCEKQRSRELGRRALITSKCLSGVEESQCPQLGARLAAPHFLPGRLPAFTATRQILAEVRHWMIYHSVYYLKWEVFLDCITFTLLTAPRPRCYQWSSAFTVIMWPPARAHTPSDAVAVLSLCRRFVSDFGPEGYDCVCQHRLLQGLQGLTVGPEHVRTYPPCLLEWTANRKRAHTVLHIHCFDGESAHRHVGWLWLIGAQLCMLGFFFLFPQPQLYWRVKFNLLFFKTWLICCKVYTPCGVIFFCTESDMKQTWTDLTEMHFVNPSIFNTFHPVLRVRESVGWSQSQLS